MTLLGKIFTVLIFIMSLVFMTLATATFATHRDWRKLADNNDPSSPGLKQRIETLVAQNDQAQKDLQNAKNELAAEQAARRAALATLQGKLKLLEADLKSYSEQLSAKQTEATSAGERAKALTDDLKVAVERVATLETKLREEQVDRQKQFVRAVQLSELLNQVLSTLDNLKERRSELEEQLASLQARATAAGIDVSLNIPDRPPLIDAQVLKVNAEGTLVEISIGTDDGLKKGHVLQVYRGSNYLGRIVIQDTEADRAVGVVDKKMQRGVIREGDSVTTKLS